MRARGFLEAVLYVCGTYREKGVERGGNGRSRVRENKKGRPLSEAPLFGVALSCVC